MQPARVSAAAQGRSSLTVKVPQAATAGIAQCYPLAPQASLGGAPSIMLVRMDEHRLRAFIEEHPRLLVLTGAGCSTASGIPDYRDAEGAWKRTPPVTFEAFVRAQHTRQRYWARSLIGWRHFGYARPNAAHRALAQLEHAGRVQQLVTQNVDGLHQAAGSRNVIDLHGRLNWVRCLGCGATLLRTALQAELEARNPRWAGLEAHDAPDGDAELSGLPFDSFAVPDCSRCGGILKPDVVFFGERVPPERVECAMQHLAAADALLIVGSSLMVYSGYRFAEAAARQGKPIAAVNLGRTRADSLLALKVAAPCARALAFLLEPAAAGEASAPAEWAGPPVETPA
jgi:NAD-dependent SIR2 family protein deacetylase